MAWLHGTSTPPTVCRSPTHGLRRFERSDCGCEGVSLSCVLLLSCPAPADLDRSLKRGRGASTGTAHTECIRLLYTALDLRAFFFKVQKHQGRDRGLNSVQTKLHCYGYQFTLQTAPKIFIQTRLPKTVTIIFDVC